MLFIRCTTAMFDAKLSFPYLFFCFLHKCRSLVVSFFFFGLSFCNSDCPSLSMLSFIHFVLFLLLTLCSGLSFYRSPSVWLCLPVCLSVSVCLSFPSFWLSVSLSVRLSVCAFVFCLSIGRSICLSVCPSSFPFNPCNPRLLARLVHLFSALNASQCFHNSDKETLGFFFQFRKTLSNSPIFLLWNL